MIPLKKWASIHSIEYYKALKYIENERLPTAQKIEKRWYVEADDKPLPPKKIAENEMSLKDWATAHNVSYSQAKQLVNEKRLLTAIKKANRWYVEADDEPLPAKKPQGDEIPLKDWADAHNMSYSQAVQLVYKKRLLTAIKKANRWYVKTNDEIIQVQRKNSRKPKQQTVGICGCCGEIYTLTLWYKKYCKLCTDAYKQSLRLKKCARCGAIIPITRTYCDTCAQEVVKEKRQEDPKMIAAGRRWLHGNVECGNNQCCICGEMVEHCIPDNKVLLSNFTDFQIAYQYSGDSICTGCAMLFKNPDLRQQCILSTAAGDIEVISYEDAFNLLDTPPSQFVLSVPYSHKKHHWLYAGLSTPEKILIGTDDSTIMYIPERHKKMKELINKLLHQNVRKQELISGNYNIMNYASSVQEIKYFEEIIGNSRSNGLVKLLVTICPIDKNKKEINEPTQQYQYSKAHELLYLIAKAIPARAIDGIKFWNILYISKINKHKNKPLRKFANDICKELFALPANTIELNSFLDNFSEEEGESIMQEIRQNPVLCTSKALSLVKLSNEMNKPKEKVEE